LINPLFEIFYLQVMFFRLVSLVVAFSVDRASINLLLMNSDLSDWSP